MVQATQEVGAGSDPETRAGSEVGAGSDPATVASSDTDSECGLCSRYIYRYIVIGERDNNLKVA